MPVHIRQRFGSALDLGLVVAAFGRGAMASTLLFRAVGHRLPRRPTFILTYVLGSLPFRMFATPPALQVIAGAAAFAGVASGPLNPILGTVIQKRVPPELLGRVYGVLPVGAYCAIPAGIIGAGTLAEKIGIQALLVGMAGAYLLVSLSLLVNPSLRWMEQTHSARIEIGRLART
jgi:predicted MFS family arabinose efflux permease